MEDVEKAWAAYMAEEDPVKAPKLEKRWKQASAQEVLDSFRRQQVAGGKANSNQASGEGYYTWMMLLAQAQSYCPLDVS